MITVLVQVVTGFWERVMALVIVLIVKLKVLVLLAASVAGPRAPPPNGIQI